MKQNLWSTTILGAATATLLGGLTLWVKSADGQWPGVTFEVLAGGYSGDKKMDLKVKGPTEVLQAKIVGQPGSDIGWHTHPGPAVMVIKSGSLTEYDANGCVTLYPAGSVLVEEPGVVHRVVNHGSVSVEAYATFLLPAGTQPLQPAPAPVPGVCRPGHH